MSEKHPPVPPNCPALVSVDGRLEFSPIWPADKFHPLTEPFNAWQRPIIAAVARCAWLDEAEKEAEDYRIYGPCCSLDGDGIDPSEVDSMRDRFKEAIRNASAWAKWARGEAWE